MSTHNLNWVLVSVVFAIGSISPSFLLPFSNLSVSSLHAQQVESMQRRLEDRVNTFFVKGQYDQAVEQLSVLTKTFPKKVDYHSMMADARFMNGQMEEAIESYDRAIELAPALAPRRWQRGLALYYAGKFEAGKKQFESHQTVNHQDVENSVWHMLCNSKVDGLEDARKAMIPISGDQRVPMPEVFQMFSGEGTVDQVLEAARAAGGRTERTRNQPLYYAHLYIGLYYEMTDQPDKAIESMKQASQLNPLSKAQLMSSIADVHLKLRDQDNRN